MIKIHTILLISFFLFISCQHSEQEFFNDYFSDGTMRIDYFHTGNAENESVRMDKIYQYPRWAGSMVNLFDKLNYGTYHHKIYDTESGDLI